MYQASEAFNDSISGNSRTFLARMEIGGKDINAEITSIVYAAAANPGDYVTIGGAVSAGVQITMKKPDAVMENAEFALSIGLDMDGTTEYVPLGLFTVQKPQNDDGMLSFTAYDRMTSKLSGAYFSELTYPVDGKAVLQEISKLTGVPLAGLVTLPDGIMVDRRAVITESDADDSGEKTTTTTYSNPFDGYTYREALGYVAQLYAKFATINRAGEIELRWYEDVDYTISASKYYDDLITTEQNFTLGSIECTAGEKTLVSGSGTAGMQITSPIMTQEHLDRIYTGLKDFSFLPASLSFFGDIRLDTGDIVKVQDKYGNIIKIPVMSITQDFDGGLMTAIASQGKTEAESSSGATKGPTAQALDRVYTDLFLVKEILGNKANFDYVHAAKAELDEALVKKLDAETADIKYAKIDFANISSATMEYFFAHSGLIKDVTIGDGTITGHLVGVTISGDLIEGNTIKAEKLVIKGTDGLYYKLNVNAESTATEQTDYNSLNGSILRAKSVTAEKISVKDLVAFGATIGGFKIGDHSLYSQGKTAVDSTVHGVYMDDDGQIGIGDAANYIKYYKDADGKYKLAISVDELTIGSSGTKIDEELDSIKDDIYNVRDEIATTLRIESSEGSALSSNAGFPVLSVIIYHGRARITDSDALVKNMGSDVYLEWSCKKKGESTYTTVSSGDSRISQNGFLFSPSKTDVESHSTFKCCLLSKGDGYVDPDQQTVLNRLESRLTDYVDGTLFPSVKEEFETVKTEVIKELSSDTYIAQIEKNTSDITELKQQIGNSDIYRGKRRQVGKATLWYHNLYDYGKTDEEAAAVLASNDIVVAGGTLYAGTCSEADRARQTAIIQKAKALNPNFKLFYYITIASWRNDGGWSHILGKGGYWDQDEADKHSGAVRIHTKWEIFQLLEYATHVGGTKSGKKEFIETYTWTDDDGVEHTEDKYIDLYEGGISLDGCFYDDAGMETEEGRINQGFPASLREKYIQLVDYTHGKGLAAFPNQLSPDWYSNEVSTANPEGKPSAIGENDYMLLESCHTQVGFNARPLWRHVNGTESVWNYYQKWYPTVGAKVVVNDYLFGTHEGEKLSDEEFYELATYLLCDSLCCGAHYLDMNGLLTWDIPEFFKKILIPQDQEYNIERKTKGHYILYANGHTLEVNRGDNLAKGDTVSLKSLKKIYIHIDGERISNIFKPIAQYSYETDQRLDTIESAIDTIRTSAKSTANIYHRMMIDDWGKELVFTNYATTTNFIKSIVDKAAEGVATVEKVNYETNGLRLIRLTNTQIVAYVDINITDKKGHTIEFGFTVNEVTNGNNWGFNAYAPAAISWKNIRTSLNSYQKSALHGENFYGYIQRVTIPEDTDEEKWRLRLVYNGNAGEVFDMDNFYAIDVDEYGEDTTKEWYTNGVPPISSASSNNNRQDCYTVDIIDDYSFDITWKKSTAWAGLKWIIPNGTYIPGHTYEFGFSSYENNAGNANVAFRIRTPESEKWVPKTYSIQSSIYKDKRPGFIFTVPESATKTDGYITLTNTSGSCQTSSGEYYKTSIRGMYLYDVDEENIVLRGSEPSNSYLKICRVTEEKLAKDDKLLGNALYFTEKGKSFMTDFNGNRVDVSGGGSADVDESRLLPIPDSADEGCSLRISNGKWVKSQSAQADIVTELQNNLKLESDGEYVYLKYGDLVLGKIQACGNSDVIYCSEISIVDADMTLIFGDVTSKTLTVAITPKNCTQTVSWTSSNEDAATISQEGILTVVGAGETIITATCGNYSDSITVTVDDPNVSVNIAKGASWSLSGTNPKIGANTARAYSYIGNTIPSANTGDSSRVYGIPLENGQKYAIQLDSTIAAECYYGLNVYSESGRVLDSGWKAAGTGYTYTPSGDGLYLYVNFKYGSAGSATITDEILAKLQNGFSVTKVYDS